MNRHDISAASNTMDLSQALPSGDIKPHGAKVHILLFMIAIGFCGAATRDYIRARQANARVEQEMTLPLPPEIALGRANAGSGPGTYTLVEFADYQCPPCRAAQRSLSVFLERYRGRMRFVFRNLPITALHPYAMPAAIAAEAAREQNRFWPVHDALFTADISYEAIQTIAKDAHLDLARFHQAQLTTARAQVDADLSDARRLGLSSTPSFVLCCPDGRVLKLLSLSQLSQYMP